MKTLVGLATPVTKGEQHAQSCSRITPHIRGECLPPMILALDPGLTTGWAVLDLDGEVKYSGNQMYETFVRGSRSWNDLVYGFAAVVIEQVHAFTKSKVNTQVMTVVETLRREIPGAYYIPPGVWKPVMRAFPVDYVGTQHERDAVQIGRYFLRLHVHSDLDRRL